MKPLHSGVGLYPFIMAICRQPGLNQEALSEILVLDKGTTAKAVKELENERCIVREPDCSDRRTNRLFPTAHGEALGDELDMCLLEWKETLWKGFSESEKHQSYDLVKRMAANAMSHVVEARDGAARSHDHSGANQ